MKPVNSIKPFQALEILHITCPLLDILTQSEDGLGCNTGDWNFWRKHQRLLPISDFQISLPRGFTTERRISYQHLVHDDSQWPPITSLVISRRICKHLRSDVVRSTNCGECQRPSAVFPTLCSLPGTHGLVCGNIWPSHEVSVIFGSVRLLEASTEAKVW